MYLYFVIDMKPTISKYHMFISTGMRAAEGMGLPRGRAMKLLAMIWNLHKNGELGVFISLANSLRGVLEER